MIFVAQQTILARRAAVVTGLAEILLDRAEVRREISRIALLIALEIGSALFKNVTGQTSAIFNDAYPLTDPNRLKMRLMNEVREASSFVLDRKGGEIDHAPFAPEIVDAVAFRT